MPGNSLGTMFKITTFGESHGEALGVVIDGMPAGLTVDLSALKAELKRRAPGQHEVHTGRKEDDEPEILSGVEVEECLTIVEQAGFEKVIDETNFWVLIKKQ